MRHRKVFVSVATLFLVLAAVALANDDKIGATHFFPGKKFAACPVRSGPLVARVADISISASTLSSGVARIGHVVTLEQPITSAAGIRTVTDSGERLWTGSFDVPSQMNVRLHLEGAVSPASLEGWVCDSQHCTGFDVGGSAEVWTPSVEGPTVTLVLRGSVPLFAVREAALYSATPQSTSCFRDAACYPAVKSLRTSVAQLIFISGNSVEACSGGLIIDRADKFPPFILTANHCISTALSAATVEAFFDMTGASCGGALPPTSSLPRVDGATLLATSSSSDVTLLRLSSDAPGIRTYLGWHTGLPPSGTTLYRVSHPASDDGSIFGQTYSSTVVDSVAATCASSQRPQFIYSQMNEGGVGHGSSGAPSFDADGSVYGQLLGGCGLDPSDGCSSLVRIVDGAFATSYPILAPYLEDGSPSTEACVQTSTTLCLSANRFAVSVVWRDFSNNTGVGNAVPMTADTGHFWFFSQTNVELVIKVLDARTVNGKFWVFYGALSNVEYTITVRDTQTGVIKTYFNPSGTFASKGDVGAF